jgi:hypothetical protein
MDLATARSGSSPNVGNGIIARAINLVGVRLDHRGGDDPADGVRGGGTSASAARWRWEQPLVASGILPQTSAIGPSVPAATRVPAVVAVVAVVAASAKMAWSTLLPVEVDACT